MTTATETIENTMGRVTGIIANLVIAKTDGHVAQNEICHIAVGEERLLGEVIKVQDQDIFIQCYESTRGLKVGNEIEFSGDMLEVTLGPGMLSKTYDGLQNDLNKFDELFIRRGVKSYALDEHKHWHFKPLVKEGDMVHAGDWLGEVPEEKIILKVMVPFKAKGSYRVESISEAGEYKVEDTIAKLVNQEGQHLEVNMVQKWPVKRALKSYAEKVRPFAMLETGVRAIDSLNPIMDGGTGFIPRTVWYR